MGDVITGALGERLDSQMMDDSLSQSSVFSELKDARTGGEDWGQIISDRLSAAWSVQYV